MVGFDVEGQLGCVDCGHRMLWRMGCWLRWDGFCRVMF